ncbi:AAA family ATPase [Actinacidiphila sp. DG2A-62]|uniref:AAA family ATPase n=1 Tax=Actinacidiphila sp. DG2A-62 TaxID=3108821 RepID=UPI002DBAE076|nr:AAA family ATPase [Actinacidiphila sp. DG2A-62]MEC3993804.1 AAA family ATPase [Actinacidiphila sp. DG2A-62]
MPSYGMTSTGRRDPAVPGLRRPGRTRPAVDARGRRGDEHCRGRAAGRRWAGAGADSGDTLIGRDRESAVIDRGLADPDGPRVVFVVGERGAGRTAFLRAAARRHGAAGGTVLPVDCVPGDGLRPYLLALRLVRTLEQHRPAPGGPRRTGDPVAEMTAAVEHDDRAAAAEALTEALAHAAPALVVVDDVQYADRASVDLLGALDMARAAPGVRLVLSLLRPGGAAGRRRAPGGGDAAGLLPGCHPAARVIELAPLARAEVAALLARRLPAVPDSALIRLVHYTSRGLPAAVDILLAEWARHGEVLTAGRPALLYGGRVLPAAPRDNRFTEALRALGEPAEKVASGLSVLWPLGSAVCALIAEVYGLPAADVRAGLRELLDAGIVEELPVREDGATRGWTFRVPLTKHAVRERLGPLERGRLAAAAVQALWAAGDRTGGESAAGGEPVSGGESAAGGGDGLAGGSADAEPAAHVVAEADAGTYLPDRIVKAGPLIDTERAVAELVAATERMGRGPGRRFTLQWLKAAAQLAGETTTRDELLLARALRATVEADHRSVRGAVGELLQSAAGRGGPGEEQLQMGICALAGSTSGAGLFPELSHMTEARWWWPLGLPPAAVALGRALALCCLGRWRAAEEVLGQPEAQWSAGAAGVLAEVCRGVAELVLGRPERFRRSLTLPEIGGLSEQGRQMVTLIQVQQLLNSGDLREAAGLLAARGMTVEETPAHLRFQWRRLEGRWDEAMGHLRWLRANGHPVASGLHIHLYPERATVILLARGRIGATRRLIADIREGLAPLADPRHLLDRAEAEVARTLGDPAEAVRVLRRGLETARTHGEVFATDELLAELVGLLVQAGDLPGAAQCVRQLEEIAARTESGRSRLLWLVASARLHAADDPDAAGKHLTDAVALARSREQPFETATTLLAAARLGEKPASLLTEAYELFGQVGAPLWRFQARTDMRRAKVPVPDHDQAMAEGDRLLATLVSEGLRNRQIAAALGLSPDAVANRLTRLFARTGARSRTELVTAVLRRSMPAADW